jgi:hypothetical protein
MIQLRAGQARLPDPEIIDRRLNSTFESRSNLNQ